MFEGLGLNEETLRKLSSNADVVEAMGKLHAAAIEHYDCPDSTVGVALREFIRLFRDPASKVAVTLPFSERMAMGAAASMLHAVLSMRK